MPTSLVESQAITEMAGLLRDFLPGNPHPYADQRISFAGVAHDLGLSRFWSGGSKLPAISTLLEQTLTRRKNAFCHLVLEIVRRAIVYRKNKGSPVGRNEIGALNELVARVGFKIPEMWDPKFLESLPPMEQEEAESQEEEVARETREELREELVAITNLEPQPRGYAFEKFLNKLFAAVGLKPRAPFRLIGEQIDGSLEHEATTYLVEGRWQDKLVGNSDLLTFHAKVEGKSAWSRGLFISHSGFTQDGLEAFSKGRPTSIIGMTGQDLYFIVDGKISLPDAIRRKARHAAETGQFLITAHELSL